LDCKSRLLQFLEVLIVFAAVRLARNAAERSHDRSLPLQNLDLHLAFGLLPEEVRNRRAAWRVWKVGRARSVCVAAKTPADGIGNGEEMHARGSDRGVEVPHRPQVVENPDRSAMC